MGRKTLSIFYRQFVRIITFIDLPINRKFTLFSLGVIFWLLALASVAVVALVRVDLTYSQILRETIPHQRVAQKINAEMVTIDLEISDLYQAGATQEVLRHSDLILTRLDEVQGFAASLASEGVVLGAKEGRRSHLENLLTPSGSTAEEVAYLREINGITAELVRLVREATSRKIEQLQLGSQANESGLHREEELKTLLRKGKALSFVYDGELATDYRRSTAAIEETIRNSFLIMFGVLSLALILLVIFTRWIAVAIAEPIRAIIGQIHSLGTGDVDLSEKISISSQDEIGTLATEFNGLMESVYSMTAFKAVIEEDTHQHDIYARLGDVFARVAQINNYCIYEIKDNQHEMMAVYPLALQEAELHCNAEILGSCELCRVRKTGHQISSLVYPGICQQFKGEGAGQQHVCVPVNVGGHIGVVIQFLFTPVGGIPLDRVLIQHQIARATVYLKEAQSVLEAKRLLSTLRDSALKDALTGLYNRRFLQEHSQQVVAGCHRRGTNIGLLMCDLDYFKQVNDQYGHEIGDLLLRETATALLKAVRESDYVIRFGGEEFLVLLIDVGEGEADAVAEKIRQAVAAVRVQTVNGSLSKTISIGVSIFPADGEAFWQTIKFADVALYQAKEIGRDRVVRFAPGMWSGDSF